MSTRRSNNSVKAEGPLAIAPLCDPRLRAMAGDEAPKLQQFYNGLCQNSRRLFRPLGWVATLEQCEQVAAEAAAGERFDVVAEVADRLVGWAFLVRMSQDVPHLGIGCADDFLGVGLGRRLMQAVMDEARAQRKRAVDLIVVQENDRARRLYERFGFRVTGTQTGSDGLEYFQMVADLGPESEGAAESPLG